VHRQPLGLIAHVKQRRTAAQEQSDDVDLLAGHSRVQRTLTVLVAQLSVTAVSEQKLSG
jgi:hypothetical protein